MTSLITITAAPSAQPTNNTPTVAVGVGIGAPLGLALIGALIAIYSMRKRLQRATEAEKAALSQLHQSGFVDGVSGYHNTYGKNYSNAIQEAPNNYKDRIHEVSGN